MLPQVCNRQRILRGGGQDPGEVDSIERAVWDEVQQVRTEGQCHERMCIGAQPLSSCLGEVEGKRGT
jgi:hypothetical protein